MPNRHWLHTVVLIAIGLPALRASAQDVDCIGNHGIGLIRGDLRVAASCRLAGTMVTGKVILFEGGSLTARDALIFGDVEGKRANFVDIEDSFISGHLRIEEFVGDSSIVQGTEIGSNAEFRNNQSHLEILNNDIGGNLQVSGNSGGAVISGNAVERDLRCEKNDPAPLGLGNQVQGEVREQCVGLQPEPTPSTPPPASSPPPVSPPPSAAPPPPATPPPPPSASTPPPPASTPPAEVSPPPSASSPPPSVTTLPAEASPPPATSAPPASATPPTPAPAEPELIDGGGGAFGWSVLLLLPLLAARRRRARGT